MTEFILSKEFEKYLQIYFNMQKKCSCKDISNICDECYEHLQKVRNWIKAGIPIRYYNLDLEVLKQKNNIVNKQQYMLKINLYNDIKNYINNLELNFAQGRGILIFGDFGVGKTTALMNIAKEACNKDKDVKVVYMSELIDDVYNNKSIISEMPNLSALFIEDLEHCYIKKDSNFVDMLLDSIFTLSIKYNIPLFITTNFNKQQLKDKLTPHAFSLLHEICDMYSLEGVDIRKENHL